ncbi:hypothetical protein PQJ75_00890 [Rhodoplanes sp. TEM]|uniref:Uncharacterized protein n=1 Tax=Rhodoplanes tepidamans TaxID=200616 RepID=A0ABT5J593_RHOTP|nr:MULTISPECIES: hypothetical protein [Rhodoplanes]MDC7784809.1 hypothetical protein [Rhodoplanes tepidamans]MDC7982276.1 hypothetical protein [Rhodoplanes sp. TEM]MDQ0356283.1 uncharacterized protein (UPF0335 family) [Rhodoplanes tepidamans]
MARKAKEGTNEFTEFEPALVQDLVERIEECKGDLDSERGAYMKRCRDIRDRIAGVFQEADARGVPSRALKKFLKVRDQIAKARAVLDDLEPKHQETVHDIAKAFGDAADLPLFAEVLKRKGGAAAAEEPATQVEVDNGASRLAGMKKPRKTKADEDEPAETAVTLN